MDARDTPEQAELRRSARRLARELGPRAVADLDDRKRRERLAEAVRDAGWLELRYSRFELLEQLGQLEAARPRCQLRLTDYDMGSDGQGNEWLTGQLEFSDSQAGDLHAERRSVRAQFRRSGDRRRLAQLRLGAPERRLPEARP